MRFQIAFVLSSLSPLCQAFAPLCPSAKASLCKGCCAKDFHYDAPCAKISDETECGKQIVCNWSDGPVSGAVYSAFDDFLNIDEDFYSCYESENVSSLTAYMATLKDTGAQYHHKSSPLSGACADCYKGRYGPIKWRKSSNVAPGVIAYTDTGMDLKKASEVVEVQSAPTGKYTASVPFILTMTLNFNDDGTMDFDNNVKIAHQEINCPKTKVAITDTAVTFPNIGNTGDCMGDALRGQKKDVTKFKVDINSDGTLTFHSDGWPDLKLKKASEVVEVQVSASSTVYLIRHGEKDSKGCESAAGLKRAGNMYDVFKAKFSLPSYVFAFKYSGSECQRCKQTVDPIAKKLGVSVDFTQGAHTCKRGWGECKSFAAAIKKETSTGPVLVAAEHGHIQYIANDLGVSKNDIPAWKGSDYDSVYVVTISGGKATLQHKYQTKKGLVEVVV